MEYKIKTRCTYDYIKPAQRRHTFLLIVDCPTAMVKNARCAVGYCDNDKLYPELQVKRSHVETLVFHKWPEDPVLAETWRKQVANSRSTNSNQPLVHKVLSYAPTTLQWAKEPPMILKWTILLFL